MLDLAAAGPGSSSSPPYPASRSARFRGAAWICTALAAFLGSAALVGAADPPSADAGSEMSPQGGTVTVVQAPASRQAAVRAESLYAGFGLWIFVDPETGAVVPPSEAQKARRRAYDAALNKSDQGLEPFELDNGGQGVFLSGRFRHAVKARVLADGTLTYSCDDHPDGHVEDPKAVLQ